MQWSLKWGLSFRELPYFSLFSLIFMFHPPNYTVEQPGNILVPFHRWWRWGPKRFRELPEFRWLQRPPKLRPPDCKSNPLCQIIHVESQGYQRQWMEFQSNSTKVLDGLLEIFPPSPTSKHTQKLEESCQRVPTGWTSEGPNINDTQKLLSKPN